MRLFLWESRNKSLGLALYYDRKLDSFALDFRNKVTDRRLESQGRSKDEAEAPMRTNGCREYGRPGATVVRGGNPLEIPMLCSPCYGPGIENPGYRLTAGCYVAPGSGGRTGSMAGYHRLRPVDRFRS